MLHEVLRILHVVCCALHVVCCALHFVRFDCSRMSTCCLLHAARCLYCVACRSRLHVGCCMAHVVCMLSVARCTLSILCCMLSVACRLHVVCCTPFPPAHVVWMFSVARCVSSVALSPVARCMSSNACCTFCGGALHVASCVSPAALLSVGSCLLHVLRRMLHVARAPSCCLMPAPVPQCRMQCAVCHPSNVASRLLHAALRTSSVACCPLSVACPILPCCAICCLLQSDSAPSRSQGIVAALAI